jgi:hypothetical protein
VLVYEAKGRIVNPRCLCCDKPLSPLCFDGLCYACAGGLVRDALFLRDGTDEQVRMRVAWLQDAGAPMIAKIVMGVLPFVPDAETLERVTHE